MPREVEVVPGTEGALPLLRQSEFQQCDHKGSETVAELASAQVCFFPLEGNPVGTVGYADQPHMTREVRRFTGHPPTALLNTAKCQPAA